ncbi:MAG: efflux RND transporter periplasmic adaptor subunit [bacterium]
MSKIAPLVSIILFCFLSFACSQKNPPAKPSRPLPVKFEAATRTNLEQDFETVAELKAYREISVAAERAGQVSSILVREGDSVSEGQSLVKIKGDDIKAELAKAQENYRIFKKLYDEEAISRTEFLVYETALRNVEASYGNLLIRAISSGVIGKILVDPGDYVRIGDPILELVKVHPLRVSYTIPERLIPYVSLGQELNLTSDVDKTIVTKAGIDFISPSVNSETKSVLVRASLANNTNMLKPNQYIRIKQKVKDKNNILAVREEAIYLDQGQEYVFIAEPASEDGLYNAVKKPVETGLRKNALVEVTKGINEGELVIYAGLYSIYEGAKLTRVD